VLDALRGGKVIRDQRGMTSGNLAGTDGRADAAPAHRDAALERSSRHRLRERNDEVRIVVVRVQRVRSEIDDVVTGGAKPCEQILFQVKPTMIGGDTQVHAGSPRVSAP